MVGADAGGGLLPPSGFGSVREPTPSGTGGSVRECSNCQQQTRASQAKCWSCGYCGECGRISGIVSNKPGRFAQCRRCRSEAVPEVDFFGKALVAGLVLLALVALYAGIVYLRMGGDEGAYLVAADLVRSGKIPYRDFFFPQMPLLPYIHAPGIVAFGEEVYAGRIVSGMLALGTAVAIGVGCYTVSGRRFLSMACGSLVLLSYYFLANNVLVGHHAPTSFFLALAFVSLLLGLSRMRRRGSWRWFFVAGLGMGGAAAVRVPVWLPVIVVGLLIPMWVNRQVQMELRVSGRRVRDRLSRNLIPYAAGVAVPTLFTAAIAFSDVSSFLFGVVRYNSADITFDLVLGRGKIVPIATILWDPQILILLMGSIASLVPGAAHGPEKKGAPPKWLHPSYFNVVMPFLVFMTVMLLKNHPLRFPSASGGSPILTVGLAVYVGFFLAAQLLPTFTAGRLTGGGAISVQSNAPLRTLLAGGTPAWQDPKRVARSVCGLTTPDTRVAAGSVIVFLSGRSYVEGFEMGPGWSFVSEDKFGWNVSEMERYHLLGISALVERMDGTSIGLTGGWLLNYPRINQAAEESGLYRVLGSKVSPVYISRQVASSPNRGKDCGAPVSPLPPEPPILRPPESLPKPEELHRIWDDLYSRRAAVLGSEATVLPFGDPRYGDPESLVFSGAGGKPLEFTWTMPPSAFDTPRSGSGNLNRGISGIAA